VETSRPSSIRTRKTASVDARFHAISGTYNREQIRAFAKQILDAFPGGLNMTIKRMTAEEDRVAIEAESHARHVSGRTTTTVPHPDAATGGQIVEWREYMDTMQANAVICGRG